MSINTHTTVLAIQVGNKGAHVSPPVWVGGRPQPEHLPRAHAPMSGRALITRVLRPIVLRPPKKRVLELQAGVDHHLQDGGAQLCHEVQQQSLRIKKVWADGS